MKLTIPIWNNRVSRAFDFAHRLLLVDIEHGRETGRSEITFPPEPDPKKVNSLKSLNVDVLICGAMSRSLVSHVRSNGIKVLPYVIGQADEVLNAYLTGRLIYPKYTLPGSWLGARKGFCRRRRSPRIR
jgi:predicted Fe-Mo cluster-binding NifX family protein